MTPRSPGGSRRDYVGARLRTAARAHRDDRRHRARVRGCRAPRDGDRPQAGDSEEHGAVLVSRRPSSAPRGANLAALPAVRRGAARVGRGCVPARHVPRRRAHHDPDSEFRCPGDLLLRRLARGLQRGGAGDPGRPAGEPGVPRRPDRLPRVAELLEALAVSVPAARTRSEARPTDRAGSLAARRRRRPSGPPSPGLFHSDGCRILNWTRKRTANGVVRYEYPRYLFSNKSEDILALCEAALD